jgi:hypothetical protein
MLEQQLEQAQQVPSSRSEKEQEVKLAPPRTRMSDYLLQQLGGATFSALSSVLANRATRTGNSDLGGYSAAIGGIAGSAIYNSAMRLYPDLFNNIIADVNEYFGISPQDIIREARSAPPQGQTPEARIEDIKGEGKYDSAQPSSNIYRDTTPEQIDAGLRKQGGVDWIYGKPLKPKDAAGGHIVPHSEGGSTTMDNLCVITKEDNQRMGSMDAHLYKAMVLSQVEKV